MFGRSQICICVYTRCQLLIGLDVVVYTVAGTGAGDTTSDCEISCFEEFLKPETIALIQLKNESDHPCNTKLIKTESGDHELIIIFRKYPQMLLARDKCLNFTPRLRVVKHTNITVSAPNSCINRIHLATASQQHATTYSPIPCGFKYKIVIDVVRIYKYKKWASTNVIYVSGLSGGHYEKL
uniref:Uncharacterized protein n=1 Tax=Glossina palpalis gambiensis TaxID=67801 RepID=A0A1B0BV65_9MUSC